MLWMKSRTRYPLKQVWNFEQIHKLANTEAQLAKAQQKLQQHGIQMTPQRNTSTAPALPTQSSDQATGSQPTDSQAEVIDEDTQQPTKKPRLARAKNKQDKQDKQDNTDKMDMATILNPGSVTLQDNHPTSHTDTKVTQWLDDIKDRKIHSYVKKVVATLTTMHKKDPPSLVETAIRDGVRSNGQSPTDELQEFISCGSGWSVFCYLSSGSSQFHELSSFWTMRKRYNPSTVDSVTPFQSILPYRDTTSQQTVVDIYTRIDTFGFAIFLWSRRRTHSTTHSLVPAAGSYTQTIQIWRCSPFYFSKYKKPSRDFRTWTSFCTKTDVLHWLNKSGSMSSWIQSTYTTQSI